MQLGLTYNQIGPDRIGDLKRRYGRVAATAGNFQPLPERRIRRR